MDIAFLGTCAYDFSKKLQNEFANCFDKDARRSSAILIDGRYLIDCGVHTADSLRIMGIPYESISDIVITHRHIDHFDKRSVGAIAKGRTDPVRLWICAGGEPIEIDGVETHYVEPFVSFSAGEMEIVPLPANHNANSFPLHYYITAGCRSLFYGCDGGWMLCETYDFLKGKQVDALIFDCTVGDYVGDHRAGTHNSIPMLRLLLPSLINTRAIGPNSRIIFSHIAPSLHAPHGETVRIAAEIGAEVAFDGMRITV